MEVLKPCPYCGGKAEINLMYLSGKTAYIVECSTRGCWATVGVYEHKAAAVKAWNRRAGE